MDLDCFETGNHMDILNSDLIFQQGDDAPVVVCRIPPLRQKPCGYKVDMHWEFHDDVCTEFVDDGSIGIQCLADLNRAHHINHEANPLNLVPEHSRDRLKKRSLSVDNSDESSDSPDISTLKRIKRPIFCVKEVELNAFLKLMGK